MLEIAVIWATNYRFNKKELRRLKACIVNKCLLKKQKNKQLVTKLPRSFLITQSIIRKY